MADDMLYNSAGGGRRPRNRGSLLMRTVDAAMTCLTAGLAAAMLLTLAVPYVNPARLGPLPVLALVAPILCVGVVIVMFYWIMRWRWRRAGVMMVLAFVGLLYSPRYFNPQLRRVYGEQTYPASALKVMSYNLRCFYPNDGALYTSDSVAAFVAQFNPDVICFQEYLPHGAQAAHRFDSLLGDYRKAVLTDVTPHIAIYSRFRITDSGRVAYMNADSLPQGKGMWADIVVAGDTVRVFNVHLNSTSISSNDADYIVNYRYMSDTARNSKLWDMARRLNINTVDRSYHVDALAEALGSTRHARILCGDFNDTPMSYAYNRLSHGMKDAFRECGHGYSHTFRGFFDLLRIDYAMFDADRFEVVSYEVPDTVCWSDHLPVCVRAELRSEI